MRCCTGCGCEQHGESHSDVGASSAPAPLAGSCSLQRANSTINATILSRWSERTITAVGGSFCLPGPRRAKKDKSGLVIGTRRGAGRACVSRVAIDRSMDQRRCRRVNRDCTSHGTEGVLRIDLDSADGCMDGSTRRMRGRTPTQELRACRHPPTTPGICNGGKGRAIHQ